jgi:hypothetical protein
MVILAFLKIRFFLWYFSSHFFIFLLELVDFYLLVAALSRLGGQWWARVDSAFGFGVLGEVGVRSLGGGDAEVDFLDLFLELLVLWEAGFAALDLLVDMFAGIVLGDLGIVVDASHFIIIHNYNGHHLK